MIDSLLDFSERCRLCIEPKRLSLDIFSDEGKKMKLKSKINKNLPLKVSQSDGLPSKVCYQCLFRLETWISFKQLCVERDQLMKTWSQSVLDEAASEVDATYNGGKSNCPKGTVRMSGSSRSLKKHSATRDEEAISGTFISAHHIDDAKSDSSLWEVVKMDDSGSQGEASPDRESSQVITNSTDSDYCTHPEDTTGRSIDGSKRKSWNQNTVPSSGSDTSAVIDIGQSSVRVASESLHCPILASALSSMDKNQDHFKERLSLDHSLQPMKRKRGRPSKASLQRERDMKKLRDLDNIDADHILFSSEGSMADANFKNENETPTCEGSSEDVMSYQVAHPPVVIPEFMPVTRDGGSGVTEVVLDDPDVGSMKFTLSIVDVESPESSPTLHDNFKYYNYASSSGHASSDPLLREDFEGFESPTSSNIPGNLLKDRTGSLDEIVDNISVSKIVVDVRLGCSNDINPAPMDQKQSSSVSPNCGANGSISGDLNVDHEELENEDSKLQTYIQKTLSVSKSLECLLVSDNYLKPPQEALDERNAYSDGELSESPKKRQRRKSLVS